MGTSPTDVAARAESKSPKQSSKSSPQNSVAEGKQVDTTLKPDSGSNAETTKPLAPPPRPQPQGTNTPDYFSTQIDGSLSLEPNPFEQSFGAPAPETPGGTKLLPSVAHLTSPSSLLQGTTPFNWGGGSLRTGPLSPAMLSGPTNDYFSDTHHLRGGFPTPNESSLRTGLTPGGSGSMFPAASPNSQAIYAQLAGGATPSTIDFHRTALSAAAKRDQGAPAVLPPPAAVPAAASQAPDLSNGVKAEPKGSYDPHDSDAANGLYMLAQGRNGSQPSGQYAVASQPPLHAHAAPVAPQAIDTSPQMASVNGGSVGSLRGMSEAGSIMSDDSEQARPVTRGNKAKRNSTSAPTNGRRKAEEPLSKPPASKKAKTNGNAMPDFSAHDMMMDDMSDDDDMKRDENGGKVKMTDEEKRKNFLERNRVAALKCRQRKKQWLANLQTKVEVFTAENDALTAQITSLREEVVNLKTLLLAHKDCPITQQQGLHGAFMQQAMEPYTNQMNPYGMAAPLQAQPVMSGQPMQRRFS